MHQLCIFFHLDKRVGSYSVCVLHRNPISQYTERIPWGLSSCCHMQGLQSTAWKEAPEPSDAVCRLQE